MAELFEISARPSAGIRSTEIESFCIKLQLRSPLATLNLTTTNNFVALQLLLKIHVGERFLHGVNVWPSPSVASLKITCPRHRISASFQCRSSYRPDDARIADLFHRGQCTVRLVAFATCFGQTSCALSYYSPSSCSHSRPRRRMTPTRSPSMASPTVWEALMLRSAIKIALTRWATCIRAGKSRAKPSNNLSPGGRSAAMISVRILNILGAGLDTARATASTFIAGSCRKGGLSTSSPTPVGATRKTNAKREKFARASGKDASLIRRTFVAGTNIPRL
jgi:hypothetical protein